MCTFASCLWLIISERTCTIFVKTNLCLKNVIFHLIVRGSYGASFPTIYSLSLLSNSSTQHVVFLHAVKSGHFHVTLFCYELHLPDVIFTLTDFDTSHRMNMINFNHQTCGFWVIVMLRMNFTIDKSVLAQFDSHILITDNTVIKPFLRYLLTVDYIKGPSPAMT